MHLLLDNEPCSRKHTNAAVSQFALAVAVHLQLGLALEEAVRIEADAVGLTDDV